MNGAPNFTLGEFAAKSHRELSMSEVSRAEAHARILQTVRDAVNANFPRPDGREWIVRVGSYLRPASSSNHYDGAALDWVVADPVTRARSDRLTKWARDWLGLDGRASQFSRLLLEDDHVHHVLAGMDRFRTASDTRPWILDQTGVDADGRPTFAAAILPGVDNALSLSVALILGALVFIPMKGA